MFKKITFNCLFVLLLTFGGRACLFAQQMDSLKVVRVVDSLNLIIDSLTYANNFEAAVTLINYNKEIIYNQFGENNKMFGKSLFLHGRVLLFMDSLTQSKSALLMAKNIQEIYDDTNIDLASTLNALGLIYSMENDLISAEKSLKKAYQIKKMRIGKYDIGTIRTSIALANFYIDVSKYDDAEPILLEVKQSMEDSLGVNRHEYAGLLNTLGNLYYYSGNFENIEKIRIKSIEIFEKLYGKNNKNYAICLSNLANYYQDVGRFKESELLYFESKKILENNYGIENEEYARCLSSLANLYSVMGMFDEAIKIRKEAVLIIEKIYGKNNIHYILWLKNYGVMLSEIGESAQSLGVLYEALNIAIKVLGKSHIEYAKLLQDISSVYFDFSKYEQSEQLNNEALELFGVIVGESSIHYAICLQNMANLKRLNGDFQVSDSLFDKVILIERQLGLESSDIITTSLINKSKINAARGITPSDNLEKAYHIFQNQILDGITFLSEWEIYNFINNSKYSKDDISSFLYSYPSFRLGETTKLLLNHTLFYKNFLLSNGINIRHYAQQDTLSKKIYNQLAQAQRQISKEYSKPISERDTVNLPLYEEKANALEKELARSLPGYAEAMRVVTWKEVQAGLTPNSTAIEFVDFHLSFPNENSDSIIYAALILRPGDAQPHFVPLCEARQLTDLIESQNKLSKSNLYAWQGEAQPSLYNLIWKPVAPLLNGVNTIYFSPSGELYRLNLSAIMTPSGTVLNDHFDLHQLLSTRQLAEKDPLDTRYSSQYAVVVGGINYDADSTAISQANAANRLYDAQATRGYLAYADSASFIGAWTYLSGSEKEAVTIDRLLQKKGYKVHLQTGATPTEEVIKNIGRQTAAPRILHMATHGYFFPDPAQNQTKDNFDNEPVFKISEHPLIRSGLILSGGNHAWRHGRPAYEGAEDGILTAHEVSQMNLNGTELVVLSACETGLGDIRGNEGVYGLQRAFYIAGAKYIMMSLWKVNDAATKDLTTRFYTYWLEKNMPIESAFRQAQLDLKEKNDDPEFWAGFILVKG